MKKEGSSTGPPSSLGIKLKLLFPEHPEPGSAPGTDSRFGIAQYHVVLCELKNVVIVYRGIGFVGGFSTKNGNVLCVQFSYGPNVTTVIQGNLGHVECK